MTESVATTEAPGTRFRGTYRQNHGKSWFAQIRRDGKLRYLGTFATPEEAADAYEEAANEYDRQCQVSNSDSLNQ